MSINVHAYDDRFEGVESAEKAVDVGEVVVAELAEEHADDSVCGPCSRQPLSKEMASDVSKANAVETVVSVVEDIADADGESVWWIHGRLTSLYIEAFYAAGADPAECWICHDAQLDADMECGHTQVGEPCPVAE